MHPAVKILPNYSYEDYILWEGRWELIDGIPYAMSPSPTPKHQRISSQLQYLLIDALNSANCEDCKVYDFLDYKTSEHTVVQPDILIVCNEIKKKYLDFPPSLVVEILSPSTAMKDRNNKFSIYQSQGINYYLMVDPEKEETEIYQLQDEKYALLDNSTNNVDLDLATGCNIQLNLDLIWK